MRRQQGHGRERAVRVFEGTLGRLEGRRSARRGERHRVGGAPDPGWIAERELHRAAQAAGPAVDEGDLVAAVLGQMALGIADDEHVLQQRDADGAEVAAVDVPQERVGGVVVPALDHLLDVHHGDVAAAAMLRELVVVDGAVVVDDVGGLAVLADRDVGRVAQQLAVEAIERHLRAAHDRIGRVVVLRPQCLPQVDRVHARVPAAGRQDVSVAKRLTGKGQQQDAADQQRRMLHVISPRG